jgi:hypothetical protein
VHADVAALGQRLDTLHFVEGIDPPAGAVVRVLHGDHARARCVQRLHFDVRLDLRGGEHAAVAVEGV